jgi:hypothetical protein
MNKFTIYKDIPIDSNKNIQIYLSQDIDGYYHIDYTGYRNQGNPDYLNDLKNTYGKPEASDAKWYQEQESEKLKNAVKQLCDVLKKDLDEFDKHLTVCIVPRAKAEHTYKKNQLLFKRVVKKVINVLGFKDGLDYIVRHTDTKTTHLGDDTPNYNNDGEEPYPGITKDTCVISSNIKDKDILLIDDIYTNGVNIDEDAIQALLDNGANSVIFYAVGKTI